MEVLWKATTRIINWRRTAVITYHDIIHAFWTGCSTGTAILEAKLLYYLIFMKEAVLHTILLYLQKAYGALDWDWFLNILT